MTRRRIDDGVASTVVSPLPEPPEHPPEQLHTLVEGVPTEFGWKCARAHLVYALVDPAAPTRVRYVGQTRGCVSRYYQHLQRGLSRRTTDKGPVYAWVESLLTKRRLPRMVLIEIPDYTVWLSMRERYFMHYYQERGVRLLNSVPERAMARRSMLRHQRVIGR